MIMKNRAQNQRLSCTVGAALFAGNGRVYSGINIEILNSAPTSICAEMGAIAQMVSSGTMKIKTVAAVRVDGAKWEVLQPCGACRHIISQFGDPFIIISKTEKVKLSELYPLPIN